MPIDEEAGRQRRARTIAKWAKAHRKARTANAPEVRNAQHVAHPQTRIASRTQRAASEALAELKRRQQQDGQF